MKYNCSYGLNIRLFFVYIQKLSLKGLVSFQPFDLWCYYPIICIFVPNKNDEDFINFDMNVEK